MTDFRVIEGGGKPQRTVKQDGDLILCPVCATSGIKSTVFLEIVINPKSKKGKWMRRSGERRLMCLHCKTTI